MGIGATADALLAVHRASPIPDELTDSLGRAPLLATHEIDSYIRAGHPLITRSPLRRVRRLPTLTATQARILQLMADGLRIKEIAPHVGITYDSVCEHLMRARARTGTASNEQLMAKCVAAEIVGVREPLRAEQMPQKLVARVAERGVTRREAARIEGDPARMLGALIAEARLAAGMSQAELAAAVGCSPAFINHWERGARAPSLAKLARMAEELGVSMRELVPDVPSGGRPARAPTEARLTPAEVRALRGIADGWRTREIADVNGLSVDMVKDQLESARRKLRARTTAQAVAVATRDGEID